MTLKIELRKEFISLRKAIPKERRIAAAKAVEVAVQQRGLILSFHSFGSEIDLSLLNHRLASENRLLLPRVEGNSLAAYKISDLTHSLQKAPLGGFEPNPHLNPQIAISKISLILVPGLAFDREHFRLGYGRGYYDCFLKEAGNVDTLGIGFKEQLVEGLLPKDPWDVPLENCSFF